MRRPIDQDPVYRDPDIRPWPLAWRLLFLVLLSIGLWAMIFGAVYFFSAMAGLYHGGATS